MPPDAALIDGCDHNRSQGRHRDNWLIPIGPSTCWRRYSNGFGVAVGVAFMLSSETQGRPMRTLLDFLRWLVPLRRPRLR